MNECLEVEIYAKGGILIAGTVEFDLEFNDESFDYEYGLERGVWEVKYWTIGDWDLSQLKVFLIGNEEDRPLNFLALDTDDETLIQKEIERMHPCLW